MTTLQDAAADYRTAHHAHQAATARAQAASALHTAERTRATREASEAAAMTCNHGMRWAGRLFACELELGHDDVHRGHHPEFGDTEVAWLDGDRRDFTGGDPGQCERTAATVDALNWSEVDGGPGSRCILPAGHHGRHAS